jgi:large subunit ribosomal protein L9
MQVILLERVEKLGQMGDVVKVKDGFARNFLLPKKKALRATKTNAAFFETQRAQLETRNLERKAEAEKIGKKLEGQSFMLLRQAGDRGQLYGSVSPRDISEIVTNGGFTVDRTQIPLDKAIKTIGLFPIAIVLHPEVRVTVTVNVARTEDEAQRQARGEDVLSEKTEAEEAEVAAEELFEEGAGPQTDGEEPASED